MYALNRLSVWRSCELCVPIGDKQPQCLHDRTTLPRGWKWLHMLLCVCMHYDSECVTADIIIWVGWRGSHLGIHAWLHTTARPSTRPADQCLGNMWWNSGHFSRADSASACYSHSYHLPTAPREELILFESKRLNQINGCMNKPMI